MNSRKERAGVSRREVFRTGAVASAGLAAGSTTQGATTKAAGPDPYSRIGVRPFINCTATITINGGSLTLPEVVSTIEQGSHYHVNLNELMEKVGDHLAKLLEVEWGMVTAGASSSLTHATAGCIAGTDPEKIQRLPNLQGLKSEVIMPRESRNAYDHAIRNIGVKIIEVDSSDELRSAIGPHSAMIAVLGQYFGSAKLDLKDVAPIAKAAGVPILVDAAADYLIVPNPYIALGADLVAYSGGKIIRGPQTAGLLVGRRDLVRAAWANSAPHHSVGRSSKVSKEEILGMLRAVEVWCTERDVAKDFKLWESWYADIAEQITKIPGVETKVQGPIRGGPFPTLNIAWDPAKVSMTAGEVGRAMLEGDPRIATHAEGEGHSFLLRPVALKPGEHKIVAQRLYEVFKSAPKGHEKPTPNLPALDISGEWEVDIEFEVGSGKHRLVLAMKGNSIEGRHQGWAYQGNVKGEIDGSRVWFRSTLPAEGNQLSYLFKGSAAGDSMHGEIELGDYGKALFRGRRQTHRA